MADSKVISLRINDKTKEMFKNIADEIGGNQDEIMSRLCNTYNLQKDKAELPEDRQAILDFEQLTEAITLKFIENIKAKATVKEKVKQDFILDLESKDNIIKTLQDSIAESELKVNAALSKQQQLQARADDIQAELSSTKKELEDQQNNISQKDDLIQALKSQVSEIEHMRESMKDFEEFQNKFVQIKESAKDKEIENQNKIQELRLKIKTLEMEKIVEKTQAVSDAENKIRDKYESKLEQRELTIEELRKEIENLRKKVVNEV